MPIVTRLVMLIPRMLPNNIRKCEFNNVFCVLNYILATKTDNDEDHDKRSSIYSIPSSFCVRNQKYKVIVVYVKLNLSIDKAAQPCTLLH